MPRGAFARTGWLLVGLLAVGLGGVGIVVPGLPTTVFFIIAAWAFSKSSPRLEAWVLGLPRIGPMVQNYRDGLGMPRRAKAMALSMMIVFVGISLWLIESWFVRVGVVIVAAVGVGFILFRVPTSEETTASKR